MHEDLPKVNTHPCRVWPARNITVFSTYRSMLQKIKQMKEKANYPFNHAPEQYRTHAMPVWQCDHSMHADGSLSSMSSSTPSDAWDIWCWNWFCIEHLGCICLGFLASS